jgi:TPR repeat protein
MHHVIPLVTFTPLEGVRFGIGFGIPVNESEAVRYYRSAAEQNHSNAQVELGTMYSKGKGVTKDYKEALKWHGSLGFLRHEFLHPP